MAVSIMFCLMHAAGEEGRIGGGGDMLAAAAAVLERHRLMMQNRQRPDLREAAVAGQDPNTAPHRHRYATCHILHTS